MVKRIDITYDGKHYSLGFEDFERVRGEVEAAYAAGEFRWISVNAGEGRLQPAQLLVGPGIPIALVPVPGADPSDDDPDDTGGGAHDRAAAAGGTAAKTDRS